MDSLSGQTISGAHEYPLYRKNVIGPLHALIGESQFAVICAGFDPRLMLPSDTAQRLDELRIEVVQLVPPDGDGARFYCDLDFAYTAFLADNRQSAVAVRRDYRICGLSVDDAEPLAALVASLLD